MIFFKKCLGCPTFLGYICWPKVVGALLLLSAPLALLYFRRPWPLQFEQQRSCILFFCLLLFSYFASYTHHLEVGKKFCDTKLLLSSKIRIQQLL